MSQINLRVDKTFLVIVFSIQAAALGVLGFDSFGINIPFIRPIVELTYLSLVPGLLILKVLKFKKINLTDMVLYSIGLSISLIMLVGFILNSTAPFFNISNPISIYPLMISIEIIVFFLCVLVYISDKNKKPNPTYRKEYSSSFFRISFTKSILSLDVLFLLLLPFFSIFGTYLMNFAKINILSLFLILLIGLTVILIGFDKFIKVSSYPLAVFTISLSLLYHTSLISMYLWGTDIHSEYYYSNYIVSTGIWDPTNFNYLGILNSILTDSILNPVYSIFLNVDLTWIFKILYPFIFSFVPLGLYQLFRKQTNEKTAFFASFFFMAESMFYTIMLEVPRQQIAEFFFVLIILTFVDKNLSPLIKSFFLLIFSFSLTVSHYGISYIYLFSLILSWILLRAGNLYSQFSFHYINSRKQQCENVDLIGVDDKSKSISNVKSNFVLFVIVLTLGWYIYNSHSSVFESVIKIFDRFISIASTNSFDPNEVEGLKIAIMETVSLLHSLNKYVHQISIFLIFIGVLSAVTKQFNFLSGNFFDQLKLNKTYLAFSITFLTICFSSLIFPSTSAVMGTSRVYHTCLSVLSPFCIIGYLTLVNVFSNVFLKSRRSLSINRCINFFSIFLVIFLLFSSGFIYELAKDHSTSIGLNCSDKDYRVVYNDGDVAGILWVSNYIKSNELIYTGASEYFLLYDFLPINNLKTATFSSSTDQVPVYSYILLDPLNLENQILDTYFRTNGFTRVYSKFDESVFFNHVVVFSNKVYNNGIINAYRTMS